MFDEHFPPQCASTVMRWTPTWSKQSDPSGRAIASHNSAYKEETQQPTDSGILLGKTQS